MGTYLRTLQGILHGIIQRLKPFSLSLYVTIIAVMSTSLASFFGNIKVGTGAIVNIGRREGGGIVARVKGRR